MARSVAPAYLAEGSGGTLVNAFPTSGSSQSMEPEKVVGRPSARRGRRHDHDPEATVEFDVNFGDDCGL